MQPRHVAWSWAGSAGGSLTRWSSVPYTVFGGQQLRRRILTQLLLLWACVLECWAPQICCATEHTRARHRPTRTNTYFSTLWAHGLWERWLSPSPSPAPQPLGPWKEESQVAGAQAKWLRPPRAVCPTSFNEMDGGSHSRTACRALPYLMRGVCVCVCVCVQSAALPTAGVCVCVCVCVCRALPYLMQGCVCVCVCVCVCGWGRGKWGDTVCTRAGMALRYFTHPFSERAFILHILSLWNLRLGEFNSHN